MSLSIKTANDSASNNGRYHYLSVLGTGSFGTVFKAKDTSDDSLIAIKIVKTSQSVVDLVFRRRATQYKRGEAKHEADILHKLKHPNIVALHDYFDYKEGVLGGARGLVMTMEICPNGNLQEYLTKSAADQRQLPMAQRKKWYGDLSSALQFIHASGIVHRDLKPPNILLDKHDNLKVADVGLAKAVWDIRTRCKETSHDDTFSQYMSSLTGTPCYMAPEVWEERYSTASDVFSLGLIFVMIAEVPNPPIPFAHWNQNQYCLGKLLSEAPALRGITPTELLQVSLMNISAEEHILLNKMLAYDAHERVSTVEIMESIDKLKLDKKEAKIEENESNSSNGWWSCVIS